MDRGPPAPRRIESVVRAELAADRGLMGDHCAARVGGKRQVTLIQSEHLAVVAALCGLEAISPALLRRILTGHTDWEAVALLYEGLVRLAPTIGAVVGRAAAVGEARCLLRLQNALCKRLGKFVACA